VTDAVIQQIMSLPTLEFLDSDNGAAFPFEFELRLRSRSLYNINHQFTASLHLSQHTLNSYNTNDVI
jgi:hypothetical protein